MSAVSPVRVLNRDSDHLLETEGTDELFLKHAENSTGSRSRISPSYYSAG